MNIKSTNYLENTKYNLIAQQLLLIMKKKLPIGIQSFLKIREDNFYYVDKTHFVKKLVDEGGGYYFLSRPRRFGKSLFLDTIKQAFLGKKELFEGLYLEKNWDWSRSYPVIHISFGEGVIETPEILEKTIEIVLNENARRFGISLETPLLNFRFKELIIKLNEKYNQKVVVLIDEYDKPILDRIEEKDTAIKIRDKLKNFYAVLKDADQYLKLVFITGVSKFSKVSLFSGLNQLNDITLDRDYAEICGYTEKELVETFKDELRSEDELKNIRLWYNGYSWGGEKVYNPFDILLYLQKREFRPYWFETGTPTFLIKLLLEKNFFIPRMENMEVSERLIGSFDVDFVEPENLLFQTGYLTVKDWLQEPEGVRYTLTFPNREVKISFSNYLLYFILRGKEEGVKDKVKHFLREGDIGGLREALFSLFAGIPYDWYRKAELGRYEGFYASILYSYFCAIGAEVRPEDITSEGRIDLTVIYYDKVYIFEFKVVGDGVDKKRGKVGRERKVKSVKKISALQQIKERRYWEKYTDFEEIYIVGVEFSKKKRNILNFEWEKLNLSPS